MEDLATLEGKTLKELREIAKAFGIASEKLSKRTLIKIISGGSDAEEPAEEVALQVETTPNQPKRRGRRPRAAEKVEIASEPEVVEVIEPVAEPTIEAKAEQVVAKAESKRRGRPKNAVKAEQPAQNGAVEVIEAAPESVVEPVEEIAEPA
jgi:transposase-like protein